MRTMDKETVIWVRVGEGGFCSYKVYGDGLTFLGME